MIPSYTAVRSKDGLLVRLDLDPDWVGTDIAWEFYSYAEAPYERTNRFADPAYADEVAALRRRLERFLACQDTTRDEPVRAAAGRSRGRDPVEHPLDHLGRRRSSMRGTY